MNNLLLIQLIGGVGYLLLSLSYLKKEKKQILLMQIISYIFLVIHFYFLNGLTGTICNLLGLGALVTIYLTEKKNPNYKTIPVTLFILLILIINIITFQNIFSIFPMIASIIVIISFLLEDEDIIRIIGIIAAICWLIYAIIYKSYSAIIFEIIILINAYVSLIKSIRTNNK